MFNEKIRKAFEECEAFIDAHTPQELNEYEKSLELDYDRYKGGVTFSEYMNLKPEMIMCQTNKKYSNDIHVDKTGDHILQNSKLCVAA